MKHPFPWTDAELPGILQKLYDELWGFIGLPDPGPVWPLFLKDNLEKRIRPENILNPEFFRGQRILVIGAGPSGRDNDLLKKTLADFSPSITFYCRDFWTVQRPIFEQFMPCLDSLFVWDLEIDPERWYLHGERYAYHVAPRLILHACKAFLPGWSERSRISWCWPSGIPGIQDELTENLFRAAAAWIPYHTTGEGALWYASQYAVEIGVLGLEANETGYEHLAKVQVEILKNFRKNWKNYSKGGALYENYSDNRIVFA